MPTARICEELLRADPARGEARPRSYASSPQHATPARSHRFVRPQEIVIWLAGARRCLVRPTLAQIRIVCVRASPVQESRRHGKQGIGSDAKRAARSEPHSVDRPALFFTRSMSKGHPSSRGNKRLPCTAVGPSA